MRFFKASLRTLIMLASTFSFLGGWILLAHSLKPTSSSSSSYSSSSVIVPGITATPFPTLAPLPGFEFATDSILTTCAAESVCHHCATAATASTSDANVYNEWFLIHGMD